VVGSNHAVRFVVLTVLIDAIGFGIIMPVLPGIVMKIGHVGLAEATRIGGWLGVIYAAVQFVGGPLMGNLGDRFGRRPVLLGSLAGFAVDYALMAFAPTLTWLFVGRALAGLFGASYGPAGAAMADVSAPEDRARHFGMIGAAFGIGFVVGPALGGLLGELGPRAPFYAAALLAAFNFIVGMVAFPETLSADRRRPFDLRRANPLGALLSLGKLPGVLPIGFALLWWQLAGMIYPSIWAFWMIAAFDSSPGIIGLSLACVGILMAVGQGLLVGRVVKAVGERRTAQIGLTCATIGMVGYAFIGHEWMVFPWLIFTAMQCLIMPAVTGLMSRRVPADSQGELQGFNGSIAAVASIVAPLLYAQALAWATGGGAPFRFPGLPFLMAALFGLIAMTILFLVPKAQIPPTTPS
jgi:DHA1 family tetracycline resistance protein-like MFS transporter